MHAIESKANYPNFYIVRKRETILKFLRLIGPDAVSNIKWQHGLVVTWQSNKIVSLVSNNISAMTLLFIAIAYRLIHTIADYCILRIEWYHCNSVSWIINFLLSLQPAKCCYLVIKFSRKQSIVNTAHMQLVSIFQDQGQVSSRFDHSFNFCIQVFNVSSKHKRLCNLQN